MLVTPDLLARLRTLDDLVELAATLGYQPAMQELGAATRVRLGLAAPSLTVERAALLARHGQFRVYGALMADASRDAVGRAVTHLARHSAERFLFFAIAGDRAVLAASAPELGSAAPRARQLRVALHSPSRMAAEIVARLAPKSGDGALGLAGRVADVLAEEGLTGRFFHEFARMHERAADTMQGAARASRAERRDLALVFLTRVLFLYFVQSKGWLAGRGDFLPSLLDLALARGHPFHRSVFEPLCFGALSAPPSARTGAARALGDVPFLNGGLFERHPLERRFAAAALPDDTWRQLFDELFERFHFTVREQDDADAVDPEMLGRVFEGLMDRERRRGAGTYFTPRPLLREVVHRALESALGQSDAAALCRARVLDPAVGSGAFLLEALAWLDARRAHLVPDESPADRRRAIVRDNLFGVDLDPVAVRLAELRLWLALVADEASAAVRPLPNLDQNLRQGDSLLAPLDSSLARTPAAQPHVRAVAEARSAYFAATGRRKAELAHAIRERERAIAELSTDAELARVTAHLADAAATAGRDLFGRRGRRSPPLDRVVREWRRRRIELRQLSRRIRSDDALPFFAYDVHFGHVLAEGGFDVVLGNPPWIRGERLPTAMRERLAARYDAFRPAPARRGFAHLPDVSVAFVERALELACEGGVVGLLLPAKLLRAGYAGPLRALLRRRATVLSVDDLSHAAHGFAATVFPMICVLRRCAPRADAAVCVRVRPMDGGDISGLTTQDDLSQDSESPRSPWLALPAEMGDAVRRTLAAGPALHTRFRPRLGVKTGANEVFVRDRARADELPPDCRVPAIQGRDIRAFRAEPSAVLLAALDRAGRPLRSPPQSVVTFLTPHRHALERRADNDGMPLWALFRTDLVGPRWLVIWRDIATALEGAWLDRANPAAPIPLNTCYGVAVPDAFTAAWVSAWLNSPVIGAAALAIAERASGGAYRFSAGTVGALPLPARSDIPATRALARLAEGATRGDTWDPRELDHHVAAALGLAPADVLALARLGAALRRGAGGDR